MKRQPELELDAGLVEEAVLRAVRGHRLEPRFRLARERAYRRHEGRDDAFKRIDRRFFSELGLEQPFVVSLAERPGVRDGADRFVVGWARRRRDEGVDLFCLDAGAGGEPRRALGIAITAETLSDQQRTLRLLRPELLHAEDLLDPGFEFELGSGGGTLWFRDRYRVAWRTSVLGRLSREGRGEAGARTGCARELARVFPKLTVAERAALLGELFDGERPSHPRLVELSSSTVRAPDPDVGGPCPLCGFPSHSFEPEPASLEPELQAAITEDFPTWRPTHGVCCQCAALYRSGLSLVGSGHPLC